MKQKHWSSSGEDTAPVMRRRGSESLPVLLYGSLTIRHTLRAHDVAVACCLAMAEVRVRLPLGALNRQDVGKPGIPRASGARDRGSKSRRPDSDCGGTRVGTGRRLLIAPTQVRFLPPQLAIRKVKPTGDGSRPESGRAMSRPPLHGGARGFDSLTFRLVRPWPIGTRHQPSKLNRRVRFPQGALECDRGSASGRLPGLEPGDGGSTPPPRTCDETAVSRWENDAESSNGKMRRSERLHVGSIPASAA